MKEDNNNSKFMTIEADPVLTIEKGPVFTTIEKGPVFTTIEKGPVLTMKDVTEDATIIVDYPTFIDGVKGCSSALKLNDSQNDSVKITTMKLVSKVMTIEEDFVWTKKDVTKDITMKPVSKVMTIEEDFVWTMKGIIEDSNTKDSNSVKITMASDSKITNTEYRYNFIDGVTLFVSGSPFLVDGLVTFTSGFTNPTLNDSKNDSVKGVIEDSNTKDSNSVKDTTMELVSKFTPIIEEDPVLTMKGVTEDYSIENCDSVKDITMKPVSKVTTTEASSVLTMKENNINCKVYLKFINNKITFWFSERSNSTCSYNKQSVLNNVTQNVSNDNNSKFLTIEADPVLTIEADPVLTIEKGPVFMNIEKGPILINAARDSNSVDDGYGNIARDFNSANDDGYDSDNVSLEEDVEKSQEKDDCSTLLKKSHAQPLKNYDVTMFRPGLEV